MRSSNQPNAAWSSRPPPWARQIHPSRPLKLPPARWGLIAGNGRFPFLVLEGARSQGIEMAVIALREEASPELEGAAKRLHWVGLGELGRTIDLLHEEGVTRAVMAGQVKHNKIFSIRPDWRFAKLLLTLPRKNTDSLIGAVARVLESEGIQLVDSTAFLKPLVPAAGRADAARAQCPGIRGHCIRSESCAAHRGDGPGADGGRSRPRLRGHGSDGRHRRNH